jgi:hypothetical protein
MSKKEDILTDVKELQKQILERSEAHYYSKLGLRINIQWWASLSQDNQYCKIKKDEIDDITSIKTVWRGVDNRDEKEGPPMIFDTYIKEGDNVWVWASSDIHSAGTIHAIVLSQVRKGIAPENVVVENYLN